MKNELRVKGRVEKQHKEVLDKMLRTEKISFVKKLILEIVIGIILVTAASVAMYYAWSYFFPNDDIIRFLFWYFSIGLVVNLFIIASCTHRVDKYVDRRCQKMLINKRRIDRYYKYLIRDLLD